MKTIAIIGASGYIGGYLVKELAALYRVTAITRKDDSICKKIPGVTYIGINHVNSTFDIVINTSYSAAKETAQFKQDNIRILDCIQRMIVPHTQIIHLSSLAVFGFRLDIPVQPQAIPNRTDYSYVSSKLHMENLLLKKLNADSLSVIRLGNVWGPANQSWTQPVADAILWGLPVLSLRPSYSNITFIQNIASYILHLINSEQHQTFHHLAEHSNILWQQVIEEMSLHMNLEPVTINHQPAYPLSPADELEKALLKNPLDFLRTLKSGRYTAPWFPKILTRFLSGSRLLLSGPSTFQKLPPYSPDPVFNWIMTTEIPFKNHVLPGWKPQFDWSRTQDITLKWLDEAGY